MKTVLKLAGREPTRVRSKSTVLAMSIQRLSLAQTQLAQELSEKEHTCLMTDETTKAGKKYMGYEASDSEGKLWVLGLREICTKSTEHTLSTFKEILADIDYRSNKSQTKKSKLLLQHIVATMSDRASTEIKFNSLLEEYRASILPLLDEQFNDLDTEEKHSVSKLCNFFFCLHGLVHIADAAKAALKEAEAGLFGSQPVPNPDPQYNAHDPGAVRLVRTASKAFACGADEKSGCFGNFSVFVKPFLASNGIHSVPLKPFRGTRFNILFANAATTFFLNEHMCQYLEEQGAPNKRLKSVMQDLQTPQFVAGCKALGLISKLITCPLWSLIEDKHVHIIDMSMHYQQLVSYCQNSCQNVSDFMTGKSTSIFGNVTRLKKDMIFEKLTSPSDLDADVEVILRILLPAIAVLCKRIFADHLPGGHYEVGAMDHARDALKCVPKSSVFAESIFGMLDHMLKQKPSITTIASEAYIMFSQNKTLEWLAKQDPVDRERCICNARKDAKKLLGSFKERRLDVQEKTRQALKEKAKKAQEAQARHVKLLESYTEDIIQYGLWQSRKHVDEHVDDVATPVKENIAALKAQLRFRKHVLRQLPTMKEVFSFTRVVDGKRVSLSVQELATNLKTLLDEAIVAEAETGREQHVLTGRQVRHKFKCADDHSAFTWYKGKIISQVTTNMYNIT